MSMNFAFEARLSFLGKMRSESYISYGELRIEVKKLDIAQKIFQCDLLCKSAGRIGA